jgi:hypothetical protein
LFKKLSQPESIRQRDEALLNDEALIKVYKNLFLNGRLTLDPEKFLIPHDDIIYKVIVKAIEALIIEEIPKIGETNPETLREFLKLISEISDPKSGGKRLHSSTDFSAFRGKEAGSQEYLAAGSSAKKPKIEKAGAESGGEDRAPSASPSGQKRKREEEESLATQLAAGAGRGAGGGAGRGAGGGAGGGAAGGSRA